MSQKSKIICFRIPSDLHYELFGKFYGCGVPLSNFYYSIFVEGLIHFDFTKKAKDTIESYKARAKVTEDNNYLYITKNMYNRIMDYCIVNFFSNGGILNMEGVQRLVDNYTKLYESYPKDIKKILSKDFKRLCANLLDESYIKESVSSYANMKMIEKQVMKKELKKR